MLNRKSLERALAQYIAHKDEEVVARLSVFGPALLKAADIRTAFEPSIPDYPVETIAAAREGKTAVFSEVPVQIDRDAFIAAMKEIGVALRDGFALEGDTLEAMNAVDWSEFASDELLALAGREPIAFLEKLVDGHEDDDLFMMYTLPVVGLALRTFLDKYADELANLVEDPLRKDDTIHHDRALQCPACGAGAAVAAVVETAVNGNVKKLYCTCCGMKWTFERIRCAGCGDMILSDLSYVHDDGDQKHRLHVCKGCGEAFPTVFARDEMNFNPDVEQIVMTGLESFYLNDQAN